MPLLHYTPAVHLKTIVLAWKIYVSVEGSCCKQTGRLYIELTTYYSMSANPSSSPMTDLHLDAVWALATKTDPATQLDLFEQRSKTTPEGTMAHKRSPTVPTTYLARPLLRRRIQTVRPPYQKVHVPSRIFPVDTDSARGILPV